jgi:protein TonB
MTLIESLTQTLPAVHSIDRQDPFIPMTMPEPFLDIAKHCLIRNPQGRWTVDQIAARLEGRVPVPPAVKPSASTEALPTNVSAAPALPPVRRSRPPAKPNRYVLPFAVGFAVVVAALLVGPKLLHRHPDTQAAETPSSANEQPPTTATATQPTPAPAAQPVESPKPTYSDGATNAKAPVPVPALIHPEAMRESATDTAARVPVEPSTRGAVAHRAMPEVIQSARNSIHGTVKVSVKVNVDREGNVEDAELASRGPSRYFARTAVEAAKQWKFKPPMVSDRGVLSTWILQFDFTRGETTVIPTQEMP